MPLMTGRCIAPPITDELLSSWRQLDISPSFLLCRIVVEARKGGASVDLPTRQEREVFAFEFDQLTEPMRTPAYHLLWALNEIAIGRSPF
jgi:hypothetical protein